MLETVGFPVAYCETCQKKVVLAGDLDAQEQLIQVCVHCSRRLEPGRREYTARLLDRMGYDVEGEAEQLGCGSTGGGSCTSCGVS